jgi:hypothetical protein
MKIRLMSTMAWPAFVFGAMAAGFATSVPGPV